MKRSSPDEPHFKKIQIASLRLRWRTTGELAGTAGKGRDYIVATVGKQPLADARMAMMARTPQDIAESWMQLIVNMGRKEWIAR